DKNSNSTQSEQSDQDNDKINKINDFYHKEQENKNVLNEIDNPIRKIFKRVFVNNS
ncbi:4805_t:CDS:1, partial [Racocetra persica]